MGDGLLRCPGCDSPNDETSTYCIHCGSALRPGDVAETPDRELSLAELQALVYELRSEVGRIRETLAASEARPHPSRQVAARRERRSPVARAPSPSVSTGEAAEAPPSDSKDPFRVDWEIILGGNWLARIGILAVIIGVGFFLKLAFDNDWIDETTRVVLGIVGGLGLIGASEYYLKKYPVYAQTLAGGGIAILYLAIFAAFAFYGLIGIYPAVGLLFVVSMSAAALALRHDAVALALIGIFGAFLAPFIIGASDADAREAFSGSGSAQVMLYVIVVDLGVVALATVRSWRWFTLLALAGSLMTFAWLYEDSPDLEVAQASLTVMFLIFVGATTLFHLISRRVPQAFDYALMLLNASAYLGLSYVVMWDELRDWMGAFTLGLALFYGLLAYLFMLRAKGHPYLSLISLGIGFVLLTIAAPVQLGGPWLSVAWAAEGTVLVWLSFRLRSWQLRPSGAAVFALSVLWLLANVPDTLPLDLRPLLNAYMLSHALVIAAFYVAAYLVHRNRDSLQKWEVGLFPGLLTAGTVVLTVQAPVQLEGSWVAVAWSVEALALTWLSFRLRLYELTLLSSAVFAVLALWLLFVETGADLGDYTTLLNYRMLAFASGIASLYLAAMFVWRSRGEVDIVDAAHVAGGLVLAANFLTLWILSAEVIATVDDVVVDADEDTVFYTKSLALSLVWALYASAGLVLGVVKRWRILRLASLGLLALPIVKLFLFDSFALDQGFRVAAFLSLGGLLLGGGLLYQRYGEAIRGFLFEERAEGSPETAPADSVDV